LSQVVSITTANNSKVQRFSLASPSYVATGAKGRAARRHGLGKWLPSLSNWKRYGRD